MIDICRPYMEQRPIFQKTGLYRHYISSGNGAMALDPKHIHLLWFGTRLILYQSAPNPRTDFAISVRLLQILIKAERTWLAWFSRHQHIYTPYQQTNLMWIMAFIMATNGNLHDIAHTENRFREENFVIWCRYFLFILTVSSGKSGLAWYW